MHFLTSKLTARVDGCQKMHPSSWAVNSARELGQWKPGLNRIGKKKKCKDATHLAYTQQLQQMLKWKQNYDLSTVQLKFLRTCKIWLHLATHANTLTRYSSRNYSNVSQVFTFKALFNIQYSSHTGINRTVMAYQTHLCSVKSHLPLCYNIVTSRIKCNWLGSVSNLYLYTVQSITELIWFWSIGSQLPPTSTWPHLNSDVGLEEEEY